MNNPIEEIKKGRKTLKIFQDNNPNSPREWDNLGKMVLSHKRYNLPNELNINFKDFDFDIKKISEYLKDKHKAKVVLIVRGYDHSGLSISVSNSYPFNDIWDSGYLGLIVATENDILKEFKKINPEVLKKVEGILKGEIETYNQYLNGDIYGFTISEFKTCKTCKNTEEIIKNSCWGFYGHESIKLIKTENGF